MKGADFFMGFFALIPLIIYLAAIGFIIWFCVNLINAQRERNQVLKEISSKLDGISFSQMEEK